MSDSFTITRDVDEQGRYTGTAHCADCGKPLIEDERNHVWVNLDGTQHICHPIGQAGT